MTATAEQPTYRLTDREYEATRAKVEKLNARAVKKGLTGHIELAGTMATWEEDTEPGGPRIRRRGWEVTVTGTPPVYGGWEFLARAEWLPSSGGLVVSSAPGTRDGSVDRDRLQRGWCDHCQTNRRRSKVYIVRHVETREQKQVGTACVTDFTGWQNTISWMSAQKVEEELALAGLVTKSERDWGYPTDLVLAVADHLIAEEGFIPSDSPARTRDRVALVVAPPLRRSPDFYQWQRDVSAAAEERIEAGVVEKVRTFIASPAAGDSDYVHNLRAIVAEPLVSMRHLGLAVSAPQAYRRHLGRAAATVESKHLGEVDQKMTSMPVTVGAYFWFDTPFGPKAYVTFTTDDGEVLKWCTASDAFTEREGDAVEISFTVAEHTEYRGQKQTMIKRARISKTS